MAKDASQLLRDVPGYVVRHARVTVEYFNKEGEKQRVKPVVTTQSLFNTKSTILTVSCSMTASIKNNPFAIKDGLLIIE